MKISVCLPVKGRPRWLRQALFSILLQGHNDYELVIQDGDPDEPVSNDIEIKRILELFNGHVSLSVGRDGGIFPGLNNCLRRATGAIFYFLCSDDLICPGALEAVNDVFERDRFGGPLWLYGNTVSANATGKTLGVDGAPTTYAKLLDRNRIGQPAVFWNRRLMNLAGTFDERFRHAADYDLWLRFWKYCEPVYVNQSLGVHRHHDGQNTRVNSLATEAEARRISDRHRYLGDVIQRANNVYQWGRSYEGLSTAGLFRD